MEVNQLYGVAKISFFCPFFRWFFLFTFATSLLASLAGIKHLKLTKKGENGEKSVKASSLIGATPEPKSWSKYTTKVIYLAVFEGYALLH